MEENIKVLFKSANKNTKSAITSLFEMHEAVSFHLAGIIDENNEELQQSLAKAHYYATQTEIDAENVDEKLRLIVVNLLLLAKLAHNYFANEISKRNNKTEMLLRLACVEIMNDVEEIA